MMISAETFVRALFSWFEFWRTVRTGWHLLGDPGRLPIGAVRNWLARPADERTVLILASPVIEVLYEVSEEKIRDLIRQPNGESLKERLLQLKPSVGPLGLWTAPNGGMAWELAYLSMSWLGLAGGRGHDPKELCWMYAYLRGKGELLSPTELSSAKEWGGEDKELLARSLAILSESKSVVEGAPPQGDTLSQEELWGLVNMQRKYPRILLRVGTERWVSPASEGSAEKAQHLLWDFWEAKQEVSGTQKPGTEEEQHPLHGLIHVSKFGVRLPWEKVADRQALADIAVGKASLEELLIRNLRRSLSGAAIQRELMEAGARGLLEKKRREILDRVYRATYSMFHREGLKMPTPPSGWRERAATVWRTSSLNRGGNPHD